MRATRNAAKNTPPAKKAGKATAGNKGTPKSSTVEKQEGSPKSEAISAAASDVEVVNPAETLAQAEALSTKSGGADASDVNVEEQVASTGAAEMTEKSKDKEAPKSKPAATKKKVATPKKKADESSEREMDSKKEESIGLKSEVEKVVVLKQVVEEAKEKATEETESAVKELLKQGSKVTEDVEKLGSEQVNSQVAGHTEMEVEKVVEDEEMQEGGEDRHEDDDQGEAVEHEDAENGEEEEINDEEEEEDEEGEDEQGEDEQGADDLLEQRPVTERQKRKKLEVFVGGLDKEATEDDVRKVFEVVGEVVEVRMTTHPQSGKNRGYAFVRFATADQAIKAATELDRTKIRDRECAVVPSEDNDTLFVGNLCKSWKTEQVLEKLKEYGVEGIDEMTLVEDPDNEGLSRGHAFLEFVTHNDAVKAFKRLIKPDAIFGSDRSARIAWAEGSSEPDETVMARVKSVFVDGMPSEWDDTKLKEQFSKFGDIDRIVLAKNIPKSKRTDFAFVNFATRDAALAAIEALNEIELVDGDSKVKLKVELAKPAPRKKRTKGHRGSYPVSGRPAKKRKGKGFSSRGGGVDQRRGEGSQGMSRGGGGGWRSAQKTTRGVKRKPVDERPLREEKSRDRHPAGPKFPRAGVHAGATVPLSRRGARGGGLRGRGGSLSRRGSSGAHSDEEYVPLGARLSTGSGRTGGHSGRPPRGDTYPRRPERGRAYERDRDRGYGAGVRGYRESGPGVKRSYSAANEEAAYYESGQRGYPRARMEYAEPGHVAGSVYPDSIRAAPLGRAPLAGRGFLPAVGASLGSTASSSLYGSESHGFASVVPGAGDYNNYLPSAADPRGGSYPASSYYSSRTGSGYGVPGGTGPYY